MQFYRPYHGITAPADLAEAVDKVSLALTDFRTKHEFSHIVCTGTSGQAVSWPVGLRLNIPVLVVRKEADYGHAGKFVGEGVLKDYVIVDDFIGGGNTVKRIISTIDEEYAAREPRTPAPKALAIFLYNSHKYEVDGYTTFNEVPRFDLGSLGN